MRIGLRVVGSPPPDESRLVNGDSHGVSELGQQLISESLSNPTIVMRLSFGVLSFWSRISSASFRRGCYVAHPLC